MLCVLGAEPLHTPRCIDQLLFACKKRMTVGTDFNRDILHCGSRFYDISASTLNCRLVILWMNLSSQSFLLQNLNQAFNITNIPFRAISIFSKSQSPSHAEDSYLIIVIFTATAADISSSEPCEPASRAKYDPLAQAPPLSPVPCQ